MQAFIDFSALENCENPFESNGEICVQCNACGRFDKDKMKRDKLKVLERHLEETKNFKDWDDAPNIRALQERNVKADIEYLENKIKELQDG